MDTTFRRRLGDRVLLRAKEQLDAAEVGKLRSRREGSFTVAPLAAGADTYTPSLSTLRRQCFRAIAPFPAPLKWAAVAARPPRYHALVVSSGSSDAPARRASTQPERSLTGPARSGKRPRPTLGPVLRLSPGLRLADCAGSQVGRRLGRPPRRFSRLGT